jgi:dTDP-4-amino-4,6-dideoxygalactose transaminase
MNERTIVESWALLGAAPEFEVPVPVGQLYFPDWERYEEAMRGIFSRQYYTNHGPLVQEFEKRLSEFLGVRHVICVTNATIGLLMAIKGLEIKGRVVVPAFTFSATAQAITWAGADPAFCDVDPNTHQLSLDSVESCVRSGAEAILGVNLWGDSCRPTDLQDLAMHYGLKLFFDSAHAFGCSVNGRPVGGFGDVEVFSFHATKVLSATEGGCLCTNDGALAARLRNIRSSYGAGSWVDVPLTSNGRMSEAQAAIGLLSLDDFQQIVTRNRALFGRYLQGLANIPGLKMLEPSSVDRTNYQYVVAEIESAGFGLTRDQLLKVLKAENINVRRYFYPGLHRVIPYCNTHRNYADKLPNTDLVCKIAIQFPIGAPTTASTVDRICNRVQAAHQSAAMIRAHIGNA